MYIAGESYAGTYIPYFSKAILERNDNLQPGEQAINLQGSVIGNGWTDPLHQVPFYVFASSAKGSKGLTVYFSCETIVVLGLYPIRPKVQTLNTGDVGAHGKPDELLHGRY